MLQLLKNPRYDFMGMGNVFLGTSLVLVLASIVMVAVKGVHLGIEFTGGTELTVKYAAVPDLGQIRLALQQAGLTSQVVTTIGDADDHEVYIRLGTAIESSGEEDLASKVVVALRSQGARPGLVDLNIADRPTLEQLLQAAPGMAPEQAQGLALALSEARKKAAIFQSVEDLASVPGMTPEALDYLRAQAYTGPLAIRSQSYIGPAVGRELLKKAVMAIIGALIGMLVYIGFRFEFQWGLAAVLALVHDTLVTLGLFSLFGKELSLPVVAAFLTLVGYSVNDTVVIFDRVRENLRLMGSGTDFVRLLNVSINQTLSRTLITSLLTWISVVALYLFGGQALNAFSFVMVVGVIVGSYSTIYIASPILVHWKRLIERRKQGPKAAKEVAKKVRTSPSGEV